MVGQSSKGRSRPIIIVLSAIAVLAIAGTSLALGAARYRATINPNTTVSYTANTNGPVVQGIQNGTGDGMEGIVGQTAGAIGILGFATDLAHPEVALEGLAWGPSSVGLYGQGLKNSDTTHPTVGLLGTSTSGIGVEGESLVGTGTGVFGIASDGLSSGSLGVGGAAGALGTSQRGVFLEPGVDGESTVRGSEDTGGGFGLGFYAGQVAPNHGVLAIGSGSALEAGISGSGASTTNSAIFAFDFNSGFPNLNTAVLANEFTGTGVIGESGGATPTDSFFGNAPVGQYAVAGVGGTGAGEAIAQVAEASGSNSFAFAAMNNSVGNEVDIITSGGNLLNMFGTGGTDFFDNNGNETITGVIKTGGLCSGGCSKPGAPVGKRVVTYAAQSSEPTLEDFGEGQIVGGVGRVLIDSAFAGSIDANRSYMVFLTPEGDNRGLYVTQRTHSGFTVREAQGGTSTLSFMYRIVAKPYGVTAARLPMVDFSTMNPQRAEHGVGHAVAQPMEPYKALVKEVGKTRAAQILAQFKANYDARLRLQKALPHADANGTLHLGSTTVAPVRINNNN